MPKNPAGTPGNPPAAAPTVTCPTCGKPAVYAASNPARPFCSERCKLMDLGAWASESYRIADNTPPDGSLAAPDDED